MLVNQVEIGEKQIPLFSFRGSVVYHVYQLLIVFVGILTAQHPFVAFYLLFDGEQYFIVFDNRHSGLRQFFAFEQDFIIEPFVFKLDDLLFTFFDDVALLAQGSPTDTCVDN